jgi:hypothetical protein
MAAPAVLGFGGTASTMCYIVGPLAASASWIAVWEVTRGIRWLNIPLGAALVAMPLVFGFSTVPLANSVAVGLALMVLPFAGSGASGSYGGGWAALLPGHGIDRGSSLAERDD